MTPVVHRLMYSTALDNDLHPATLAQPVGRYRRTLLFTVLLERRRFRRSAPKICVVVLLCASFGIPLTMAGEK